jgi:multimeric flavodoxin WrbA
MKGKMKNLVIYYSRSGHNKKIASELAEEIDAEIEEIVDLDPKGFFISGWKAIQKRKTKIASIKNNLGDYDKIILVSPFWVGGLPPATRSFLESQPSLKNFAFLSVSGSGAKNIGYAEAFEKQYNVKGFPRLLISDPEFEKGSYKEALKTFVSDLMKEVK